MNPEETREATGARARGSPKRRQMVRSSEKAPIPARGWRSLARGAAPPAIPEGRELGRPAVELPQRPE